MATPLMRRGRLGFPLTLATLVSALLLGLRAQSCEQVVVVWPECRARSMRSGGVGLPHLRRRLDPIPQSR